MALKRKPKKHRFNPAVRGQAVRLKADDCLEAQAAGAQRANPVPEDLLEGAAQPDNDEASRVMWVITLAALAFIGFIAWCVTQMPEIGSR